MKYLSCFALLVSSAVGHFARTVEGRPTTIFASSIAHEPYPIEPKHWTCVNQVKLNDAKLNKITVKVDVAGSEQLPSIFEMDITKAAGDTSTLTMSWSTAVYSYKLYIWDKAKSGAAMRASHVVRSRYIKIGSDPHQDRTVETTLPAALTSEHKIHDINSAHVFQYALLVYDKDDKYQETPLNLGHECKVTQF